MRNIIIVFIVFCTLFCISCSTEVANTSALPEGNSSSNSPSDSSAWETVDVVDEWGDKVGEAKACKAEMAKFSNSAVSNANMALFQIAIFDTGRVRFRLRDYKYKAGAGCMWDPIYYITLTYKGQSLSIQGNMNSSDGYMDFYDEDMTSLRNFIEDASSSRAQLRISGSGKYVLNGTVMGSYSFIAQIQF